MDKVGPPLVVLPVEEEEKDDREEIVRPSFSLLETEDDEFSNNVAVNPVMVVGSDKRVYT